ncbi:MAG: dihydrodipicolinate synthase family protein [Paracoccaceae bacterium]
MSETRTESAPTARDALWVPLLTHYRAGRAGVVDPDRTLAHLRAIRPHVAQVMLAGSTGDGWDVDDAAFDALIDLAADEASLALEVDLLFGVLRPTTDEVVERLRHLERRLARAPRLAARCKGVAVCPPVDPDASQAAIMAHFEAVMAAGESPVAVYQLPQVTGCRIEPETFADLARSPRVTMFKDSSGEDAVARSGRSFGRVIMVRGAEGGYREALKPHGPYDGWLLSTGNALAPPLRRLLTAPAEEAAALSARLSEAVEAVFDAAATETGANPFSNANRAMDHLRAHGEAWRDRPLPLKIDGRPLSRSLVETVERHAAPLLDRSGPGYLDARVA